MDDKQPIIKKHLTLLQGQDIKKNLLTPYGVTMKNLLMRCLIKAVK